MNRSNRERGYVIVQQFALAVPYRGLLADPAKLLSVVQRLGRLLQSRFQPEGLYEVLEQDVRLELHDVSGHQATYFKRQRVRFLQNNVIAFQDQAWGDGDIFADYKCSPGVPVDRYREGHRYRVLISLRQTKKRDDVEEFHIQRQIRNGFTKIEEYLQTDIDHGTRKLRLTVIFPSQRKPTELWLLTQHAARTQALGTDNLRQLPSGAWQVQWQTSNPKRLESYILRWKW